MIKHRIYVLFITVILFNLILGLPQFIKAKPHSFSSSLPTIYQTKLLASDKASLDSFGRSVVFSADGNTVLVGAPGESHSIVQYNGAVYVYVRSGSFWVEQAKLLPADQYQNAHLGYSVALSADGNTVIVGAGSSFSTGAAYVFTRNGTTWTQQAKLQPAGPYYLNYKVALSADGNTALMGIGAYSENPFSRNGAAYIFTRNGTAWTQQAKLLASDRREQDGFGYAVTLSSNGNTALIGAAGKDSSTNEDAGAAYIFIRNGTIWTQQTKLLASDDGYEDYFGGSVALSSDGSTALIGASNKSHLSIWYNGAAYVFTQVNSTWTQQAKLLASDGARYEYFGVSVALSANGNIALIGKADNNNSGFYDDGSAYAFTRNGNDWAEQSKINAPVPFDGNHFGSSVALSADGNMALIGAYSENNSGTESNGAVYIFGNTLPPSTPTPSATVFPARPDTIGVYKGGLFYLRNSNTTGFADITVMFGGEPSDLPVAGDWNGDGVDTIGVYRSATGVFFLSESNTSPSVAYTILLGNPDDTPFIGKWRHNMIGDGIGVFRPSNGILYQKRDLSSGFSDYFAVFGNAGDMAFAGDWNGDGNDSIGLYRSSESNWYLTNDSQPHFYPRTDVYFSWDIGTQAVPITGDWNADGIDTVGYLSADGIVVLHSTLTMVGGDTSFVYGPAGARPIAGKWTLPAQSPIRGVVINPLIGGYTNEGGSGDAD